MDNWDAETGWPRGPHTDRTSQWEEMKGPGGEVKNFGMQKAFSLQPRIQSPQPRRYSSPWRGWPLEVSMPSSEQCLPEAGSLSHGTSVCLCIHVTPALRSRQGAQRELPSPPCLSLRLLRWREMDKKMLGTLLGLGWGRCVDLDPPLPTPTPPQGPQQGRQLGDARLPQGRAGISKLEAQGHVSLAL